MKKIPLRQITSRQTAPDFTDGFSIRNIASLLSGNDMVQELHRHDYFFILAVEKGKGEHTIDFTTYPVRNNIVFFMRPGQVHQLLLKKGSTGFLMEFNSDFYHPQNKSASGVFRKVSNRNVCALNSGSTASLFKLLNSISREFSSKQERYKEVIKSLLDIFFIGLARQSSNPGTVSTVRNLYIQERLEELQNLLETNIVSNKGVAYYAGKMHLTAYQLNAITKASLGKTCSALINDHILLEAKRLLLATTNQVNQVASMLGYEDVSYFVRFFKKHTRHTPEAFRQKFS
jgi:AraC family transcriptional activator of pobA